MGSAFDTWNDVAGPIYAGANTSWEYTWFLVAGGLCILALVVGLGHEKAAYHRAKKRHDGEH
jgi:hypothetical protein